MSISVSTFIPWYPYICSLCLCLYFCFVNKDHLYHFARFRIHALIYGICFSLSDSLHSVWHSLGPSMSLQMTQFLFYGWVTLHWKDGTLNTRIEPCSLCCTPQYCCVRSKLKVWKSENGKDLALLPSATWEGDRDSSTDKGALLMQMSRPRQREGPRYYLPHRFPLALLRYLGFLEDGQ